MLTHSVPPKSLSSDFCKNRAMMFTFNSAESLGVQQQPRDRSSAITEKLIIRVL